MQTFSQAPQFLRSVVRSVQRGFELGQSASAPHSHVPPAHVPGPQETPQAPQFSGSLAYDAGSTHVPLHRSCPDGQVWLDGFGEHAATASAASSATRGTGRAMAR